MNREICKVKIIFLLLVFVSLNVYAQTQGTNYNSYNLVNPPTLIKNDDVSWLELNITTLTGTNRRGGREGWIPAEDDPIYLEVLSLLKNIDYKKGDWFGAIYSVDGKNLEVQASVLAKGFFGEKIVIVFVAEKQDHLKPIIENAI